MSFMLDASKETPIDDLRREIAELEAEEARLSAMRRHLQHQIDFGFESATTREREREVSDERQEVHRRIDALRGLLSERQNS
jgi:chromosome segregation ATPase